MCYNFCLHFKPKFIFTLMENFLLRILDWSEVWALLIPISSLFFLRPQPRFLKPVIVYLWIAFLLYLPADIYSNNTPYFMAHGIAGNNPLYNLHAVTLFTCFSYFFIFSKKNIYTVLKIILPVCFLIVATINFTLVKDEKFFNLAKLSGNLLATSAYLLLIYCVQYYLSELLNDVDIMSSGPTFWIVTGLSIYVVTNFFVFLFYNPMINREEYTVFATKIWYVHNIAYIIFCIFITKAFYESVRNQPAR